MGQSRRTQVSRRAERNAPKVTEWKLQPSIKPGVKLISSAAFIEKYDVVGRYLSGRLTAARQLLQKGETERARRIIVEQVKGPERDQLLEDLDRTALTFALKRGKLDEAEQVVSGIRSKDQRGSNGGKVVCRRPSRVGCANA